VAAGSPAAAAPNGHAHREALGNVVPGDRQDEQNGALPSGVDPLGILGWRWGRIRSMSPINSPPERNTTKAGHHGATPSDSAIANEGAKRDQKLAVIITPAANPSVTSITLRSISRKKRTTDDPSAVSNQVPVVATAAWPTGCRSTNQFTNTISSL